MSGDDVAVADPVMTCVACAGGVGTPYSVALSIGRRTIYYRCPDCGREWATTGPTPSDPLSAPRRRRTDLPQA